MYQEKIEAYWSDPARERELVSAISRLVAVKSVKGEAEPGKPFGAGPAAALDEALKLCAELGFTTTDYDHYVGLADLNDKETRLHILGHLDVVGEGSGWSTDPYTCVEKDGMLYGRGVSDDKGPVVCALLAMKAVRDLGLPLTANVRMILGTDEESGSADIAYYYSKEPYAPYAFTPDADFPLINIEKGHYHPDFGAEWAQSAALPRVAAMTGGFRTNVVPPTPLPPTTASTPSPPCWRSSPAWSWPTAAPPGPSRPCIPSSPSVTTGARPWASPRRTQSPAPSP